MLVRRFDQSTGLYLQMWPFSQVNSAILLSTVRRFSIPIPNLLTVTHNTCDLAEGSKIAYIYIYIQNILYR